MTGRLASRAADAEALLARFNEASQTALDALDRGDSDAFDRALDIREQLQGEIERALREVAMTRSRFAPNGGRRGAALVDRAVEQYCAPLEELARVAQSLQAKLEVSATALRAGLLREISSLESVAGAATRYATVGAGEAHRFDVVL